ncbi:hypothetical protein BDL97_11G097200 [Sphagnum fallax]|nr:hypothetical protein BDL97_11G097200 [Sphagnum fallax]
MPRYTTSQTYTDGNTQIVALAGAEGGDGSNTQIVAVAQGGGRGAGGEIVEYTGGGEVATRPRDDEDLEVKLRRISEQVPVRISNTSGSSAGSGSGDFHQYRQMRRREQDRLARMEADYLQRTTEQEFQKRREERNRAAEERTAKKRAKRQKKKEKQKQKKSRLAPGEAHGATDIAHQSGLANENGEVEGSDESDDDELIREKLGAPPRIPKPSQRETM